MFNQFFICFKKFKKISNKYQINSEKIQKKFKKNSKKIQKKFKKNSKKIQKISNNFNQISKTQKISKNKKI